MGKISRRSFLAAEAGVYEYNPPTKLPFSPKRKEINRIIAEDTGKPRVVKAGDRLYYGLNYALANMVMVETDEGLVIIDTTEKPHGGQIHHGRISEDLQQASQSCHLHPQSPRSFLGDEGLLSGWS